MSPASSWASPTSRRARASRAASRPRARARGFSKRRGRGPRRPPRRPRARRPRARSRTRAVDAGTGEAKSLLEVRARVGTLPRPRRASPRARRRASSRSLVPIFWTRASAGSPRAPRALERSSGLCSPRRTFSREPRGRGRGARPARSASPPREPLRAASRERPPREPGLPGGVPRRLPTSRKRAPARGPRPVSTSTADRPPGERRGRARPPWPRRPPAEVGRAVPEGRALEDEPRRQGHAVLWNEGGPVTAASRAVRERRSPPGRAPRPNASEEESCGAGASASAGRAPGIVGKPREPWRASRAALRQLERVDGPLVEPERAIGRGRCPSSRAREHLLGCRQVPLDSARRCERLAASRRGASRRGGRATASSTSCESRSRQGSRTPAWARSHGRRARMGRPPELLGASVARTARVRPDLSGPRREAPSGASAPFEVCARRRRTSSLTGAGVVQVLDEDERFFRAQARASARRHP